MRSQSQIKHSYIETVLSTLRSLHSRNMDKLSQLKNAFLRARVSQYSRYISFNYSFLNDRTIVFYMIYLLTFNSIVGNFFANLLFDYLFRGVVNSEYARYVQMTLGMVWYVAIQAPITEQLFKQKMISTIIKKEEKIENCPRFKLHLYKKIAIGYVVAHNFAFIQKMRIITMIAINVVSYLRVVLISFVGIFFGSFTVAYFISRLVVLFINLTLSYVYYNFVRTAHTGMICVSNETDLDGRTYPVKSTYVHFRWNFRLCLNTVAEALMWRIERYAPQNPVLLTIIAYVVTGWETAMQISVMYDTIVAGHLDSQYYIKRMFSERAIHEPICQMTPINKRSIQQLVYSPQIYMAMNNLEHQYFKQVDDLIARIA